MLIYIQIFLQGLTMGLAYVAPIGTQNMFVINSALTQRRRRAVFCALTTVFFDISLALACFFGVGLIMEQSKYIELAVLGIGGLLVIFIGISLLRSKSEAEISRDTDMPIRKVIVTAFVVTWLNPQALIDGSMMLGAFRAAFPAEQGLAFIIGVMLASLLWFNTITIVLSIFHNKFSAKVIRVINIVCGIVIIGYGLKLLYTFVMMLIGML